MITLPSIVVSSASQIDQWQSAKFTETVKCEIMSNFSMDKWHGKIALVTGASAGIGAATAIALANNGVKVAACARRVEKIEVTIPFVSSLI